jgi:hypothetical protein
MARGFDSKSVEAQQEEAQREKVLRPALSAEERARLDERHRIELALAAKRSELASASSDAHRAYLTRAIRDLEARL